MPHNIFIRRKLETVRPRVISVDDTVICLLLTANDAILKFYSDIRSHTIVVCDRLTLRTKNDKDNYQQLRVQFIELDDSISRISSSRLGRLYEIFNRESSSTTFMGN